jgi:hypothetical protein
MFEAGIWIDGADRRVSSSGRAANLSAHPGCVWLATGAEVGRIIEGWKKDPVPAFGLVIIGRK